MVIARQTMHILSKFILITLLGASAVLSDQTQDENWKQCKSNDPEQV
jgi:hypothetical protein